MPAAAADVFHLPKPPTFATGDEERRHRKQRLAAAFRLFTKQLVGTQTAGWFQFQPLWDLITREEPDLLE
jgi:hypothetical protein